MSVSTPNQELDREPDTFVETALKMSGKSAEEARTTGAIDRADDQVEKLKRLGLRAERIHSGRKREDSRAVCHAYLAGNLDFLFSNI